MKGDGVKDFYEQGNVEIVGYGFPKLSFDSHYVTLLNRHNISVGEDQRNTDLYQYILDPDKMTPMQGNINNQYLKFKPFWMIFLLA